MAFLDSTSVTVDAVLTKKGREILKDGGSLNIRSFTVSDRGVDYTLWNPDHPSGSAYYGEAIENLPMVEAGIHSEYALRNRLLTLSRNTVALPALEISGLTSTNTLTFEDGDSNGLKITATLKGFANTGDTSGIYFVILNPNIVKTTAQSAGGGLSGTAGYFLVEADIPNVQQYAVGGAGPHYEINLIPDGELDKTGRETQIYIVHRQTGAHAYVTVVNNLTKVKKAILTQAISS